MESKSPSLSKYTSKIH